MTSEYSPKISVILPAPPGEDAGVAREALQGIDYDQEKIEIILANGRQPSKQRNMAARIAGGDVIYFLDSDSIAAKGLFKMAMSYLADESISGVGGPELSPQSDRFIQKAFGHVLGSALGCFNTKSRFAAVGEAREGTERSFILCNFAIRRQAFLDNNGFNESLYPNEENELINRLRSKKMVFMYDPKIFVNKSRRATLRQFIKQIFNYGRGRMEHVLIGPIGANLIYFIPLLFLFYLVSLPFVSWGMWRWPLFLYIILAVGSSLIPMIGEKDLRYPVVLPWLYLIEHIAYASGMIWGFVRKAIGLHRDGDDNISVVKVKEFGSQ